MGLSRDLQFSRDDRSENIRRAAEVARLMNRSGLICLMSLIAPNEDVRQRAAKVVGEEQFIVVHLNASDEVCASRNESAKKLTEEDAQESAVEYQVPANADLVLDTEKMPAHECIDKVVELLESRDLV